MSHSRKNRCLNPLPLGRGAFSENRTCKDIVFQETSTISRHVKDAFESGELIPDSTVAFFATVQNEGGRRVSRDLAYYNLDMIISVGYRVHSLRGVQFRMWATRTLKEYLIKGFAMNYQSPLKPEKA